jgi:transcription-repair coupling factor (superfamily II helicase)
LKLQELIDIYRNDSRLQQMVEDLKLYDEYRIRLKGLAGSSLSLISAAVLKELPHTHLFILSDKESSAYFFNDLENLFGEHSLDYNKRKILFYPASYKNSLVQYTAYPLSKGSAKKPDNTFGGY